MKYDTSDISHWGADVQPVDPLDLWTSPPFEATVHRTGRGQGYFSGRGVSDDKGGLLQPIQVRIHIYYCSCSMQSSQCVQKVALVYNIVHFLMRVCVNISQAVESFLNAKKALPVNIKFLIEGQEEIGSPNLAELLTEHKDLLIADMALSADGGQISETQV